MPTSRTIPPFYIVIDESTQQVVAGGESMEVMRRTAQESAHTTGHTVSVYRREGTVRAKTQTLWD